MNIFEIFIFATRKNCNNIKDNTFATQCDASFHTKWKNMNASFYLFKLKVVKNDPLEQQPKLQSRLQVTNTDFQVQVSFKF